MSTVGELLDQAFREPVEPTGGLLAQLMFIYRERPDAAKYVGTTPATWNRWMMHARGLGGSNPSTASREKINWAIARIIADHWKRVNPGKATVHAEIEWNGYYNKPADRTTTLTGLNLQLTIESFRRQDLQSMEFAFNSAVAERYGVPVIAHNPQEITIHR